jgi:hypothetical protein
VRAEILPTPWKLLVLGLVYFAVMFFSHLPDHLILFPTTAPIDAGGAVRKTILFEKGELEIWTAQSRRAHAATPIAPIAGPYSKRRCGMIAQLKSGE